MELLTGGTPCCITATLLDGMVLARSGFHHSTNYRSAMIFGSFQEVIAPGHRRAALRVFMEHIAPGRWDELRPASEGEMQATSILAMEIEEASVKVRQGPPGDKASDLDWEVWGGELPIRQVVGPLVADQNVPADMETPDYSAAWNGRWK